jgi:DNA polymerase-3 subunit epsilon
MLVNKYPGDCGQCQERVEAQTGRVQREDGRWRTYHEKCAPRPTAPTAPPAGDHPGWHREPLVGFDLEGTLADPTATRIVSAALVHADGRREEWLIDPRVPIPPDATARHGITDEMVRAEGRPFHQALAEIGTAVAKLVADGTPLVAFCAQYDVTALHTELTRHGLPTVDWEQAVIIDPSILHRRVAPWWRSRRRLGDLCRYYGVELTRAHDAGADAEAALHLARAIAGRHPEVAGLSPAELHRAQVGWFAEQGRQLQEAFDRQGRDEVVGLEWPLETRPRR